MLGLFYSLALHMYRTLGGWPTSIGEHGFPASLITHANLTMYFFIALVWFGMFVLPFAILVACYVPDGGVLFLTLRCMPCPLESAGESCSLPPHSFFTGGGIDYDVAYQSAEFRVVGRTHNE